MRQVATYWAPTGRVVFGNPELDQPVLIKCRWQGRAVSFLTESGEQRVSRAVVYTDRELRTGGVIALGDWSGYIDNPLEIDRAQRVAQVGSSPSVGADEVLHKVWI